PRGAEVPHQPRPLGVRADDAGDLDGAAERGDVVRHVGRAAQAEALVIELDDGHGRFGRDALDAPDDEMIEHQIADDEHSPAACAVEQRAQITHCAGWTGSRSVAYGSVTSTRNSIRNSESPNLYSNSPAASIAPITASPVFDSDGYTEWRRRQKSRVSTTM